jgi:hypothetical protein
MTNPIEIPKEQYLQKWQTAMNMWNDQISRFWMRNNVFLLINGGLVATITGLSLSESVRAAISFVGALLAICWIQVNRKGRDYIDIWEPVIIELEQHTGIKVMEILQTDKKKIEKAGQGQNKKPVLGAVQWMNFAIGLFLSMYLFLLFLAVHALTTS